MLTQGSRWRNGREAGKLQGHEVACGKKDFDSRVNGTGGEYFSTARGIMVKEVGSGTFCIHRQE